MNYDHLAVFVNLAETLNFSRTALQMNLSQSAVSQTISSMEKELNFLLFYRTRKQVQLTKSGENFYASMKPMLNLYNKSVQKAQRIASARAEDLTIGYSGTPYEISMLPNIIKEYRQVKANNWPNIYLENFAHNSLKDHLLNGDCDLIFTMPDIVAKIANIHYTDLVEGKYYANFYGPKAASEAALPLTSLSNYRLIFLDSKWCPPSQNELQKAIVKENKHLNLVYSNNILNSHVMVQANLGVGIWANFVSDFADRQLHGIPLIYPVQPHYGIAMLEYGMTKAAKSLVTWLKNNYANFV
ncbi:LysR family transcriptional regulator [Lactobacillus xylocopicola]|uniref:HTH lysR-type domain-containing protein n=1 Tax=Lactobacillus xylocopicola TaxID=2976676 RepID=A0ABM8BHI8_9LACO|nr:LysR family transcriptional regulator [Lactobacillus xylocopicola]BDR60568.1 hypothetical protein KIM322_08290 [Lactobacillus xylocopicola]